MTSTWTRRQPPSIDTLHGDILRSAREAYVRECSTREDYPKVRVTDARIKSNHRYGSVAWRHRFEASARWVVTLTYEFVDRPLRQGERRGPWEAVYGVDPSGGLSLWMD